MQIFRNIAGYSFGHADIVRRAISKKKTDVLVSEREAFVNGAVNNGVDREAATSLFNEIVSFANYAFNKSHAAAYAVLSFRTAYLKAHHPREYYAALLTSVFGSASKIAEYSAECKRIGISILPPDVNSSRSFFCVQENNIRYGLLSLKFIGEQFVDALVNEREHGGRFKDFDDFVVRMRRRDMNKKQLEALIKSGSLDSLGAKRSQMLAVYETVMDSGASRADESQLDMFSTADTVSSMIYHTEFPDMPEFTAREKLLLEKESSGVYLSGHILDDYKIALRSGNVCIADIFAAFSDETEETETLLNIRDKSKVRFAGVVNSRTNKTTRNGDNMAFVNIEDKTGEIELICFASTCEDYGYLLVAGAVVMIDGTVSVKDENEVKVIVRSVSALKTDAEYPKDEITEPSRGTGHNKPVNGRAPKLYIKVPATESKEYKRAVNFIEIFAEGNVPVIFFDSSCGKYIKDDIRLCYVNRFVLDELSDILGEENVVYK